MSKNGRAVVAEVAAAAAEYLEPADAAYYHACMQRMQANLDRNAGIREALAALLEPKYSGGRPATFRPLPDGRVAVERPGEGVPA